MTTTTQPRARRRRRGLSWRTIRAIMRREFIDVRRDRRSLILTFLYPISMLIMYGYGIRYDVDNVPLTILDYDETPESRDLTQQMIRSGYFQLVRWARDQREVDRDLTTDASKAAVIIPVRVRRPHPRRRAGHRAGHHRRLRLQHRDHRARLPARHDRAVRERTQHAALRTQHSVLWPRSR